MHDYNSKFNNIIVKSSKLSIANKFEYLTALHEKLLKSLEHEELEVTASYVKEWMKDIKSLVENLSRQEIVHYKEELTILTSQHQCLKQTIEEQRAKSLTQLQSLQQANYVKKSYQKAI